MSKPSLTLVLLQAAVEREEAVLRNNLNAERAAMQRWEIRKKKSKNTSCNPKPKRLRIEK
jgi:hypothetical protein